MIVEVKEFNGELVIELDDTIIQSLGLKEGDEIEWVQINSNPVQFEIRKVQKEMKSIGRVSIESSTKIDIKNNLKKGERLSRF